MSGDVEPMVGNWYCHLDKGQEFQVVAVEDGDSIDIQRFDGTIETIDYDDWLEMDLELIEPPEDWTGPVDDLEVDDLGYSETGMEREDWLEAQREHRQGREPWERRSEDEDEEDDDEEEPPE